MFSGERIVAVTCSYAILLIIFNNWYKMPIKKSIYYTNNKSSEKEAVLSPQKRKKETRQIKITNVLIMGIVLAFIINVGVEIK